MKGFQTVLLVIFGFSIVGAVLIFSGIVPIGGSNEEQLIAEPVIMWGTLSSEAVNGIIRQVVEAGEKFEIVYSQKNLATFESELVDALASGKGPDLILSPHTTLIKQEAKLLLIPFTSVPERTYKDSFISASEILLRGEGTMGLPLYMDPIVMYWNRDMFSRAGIASAPASWVEIQLLPAKMTKIDSAGTLTETAVALGGVSNINHFKEILATLILQTGNPIVNLTRFIGPEGLPTTEPAVQISSAGGADSALRYYSDFANPSLTKYSWNSAKRNSLDEFIAGKLGIYFGFASELDSIKERNSHLNFDVALIPQVSTGESRATYADVYSLAVLKNSAVTQAAFAVAYRLTTGSSAGVFSTGLGLPPVRRDLLTLGTTDPYQDIFYQSAVIAKTWYDNSSLITKGIFGDMIESVMIGRASPESAVSTADEKLRNLTTK